MTTRPGRRAADTPRVGHGEPSQGSTSARSQGPPPVHRATAPRGVQVPLDVPPGAEPVQLQLRDPVLSGGVRVALG